MTDDSRTSLLLLANHLRDIRHTLEQQMQAKHKWEFLETPQGRMATELMPLLSIILLLEKLAAPESPIFPTFPDEIGAASPS